MSARGFAVLPSDVLLLTSVLHRRKLWSFSRVSLGMFLGGIIVYSCILGSVATPEGLVRVRGFCQVSKTVLSYRQSILHTFKPSVAKLLFCVSRFSDFRQ